MLLCEFDESHFQLILHRPFVGRVGLDFVQPDVRGRSSVRSNAEQSVAINGLGMKRVYSL